MCCIGRGILSAVDWRDSNLFSNTVRFKSILGNVGLLRARKIFEDESACFGLFLLVFLRFLFLFFLFELLQVLSLILALQKLQVFLCCEALFDILFHDSLFDFRRKKNKVNARILKQISISFKHDPTHALDSKVAKLGSPMFYWLIGLPC